MALETQSQFARRLGKHKSYVTRLKQSGRLVTRGGKVVVDESLRLIEATESPLPRDEAKRAILAEERQQAAQAAIGCASLEDIGRRIKSAQARKLAAEADKAEMERARIEGSLVDVDEVKAAATDIAAALREALETLPDRLAPEVAAAQDTTQAHALLSEHVEIVLREVARVTANLDRVLSVDA